MKKNPVIKPVQAALAFVVIFLGLVMNAQAVTSPSSPSSFIVKIFEMRVSRNSDCSGAVSVFNTASPTDVDLFSNHGLGSGVISTGTYHCVMFRISANVTFTPADNLEAPICVSTMTYSYDIYQLPNASVAPDGTPVPVTGVTDTPWVYLSDGPGAVTLGNGCFQSTKTDTGRPCVLAPLTILSDQTHMLVMNANNQLEGIDGKCVLNPYDPMEISIR